MYHLKIQNFKCFINQNIPINRLTVLTGANGNGKSTVIQSLLFMRRTIEHCATWENDRYSLRKENGLNVELNGAYNLALGNNQMIIPINISPDFIEIGISDETGNFSIKYKVEETSNLYLTPFNVENNIDKECPLFLQEFYYLNAERLGPRISQGIKFYDFPNAGFQGEFVAQLIADTNSNYKFEIDEKRKNKNSKSPRLEQQVNAWLNELMPGVSIEATYNASTHSAQIKVANHFTKGDTTIAPNIGFGISYVLPILVTGLIAKEGSIMIVENPEAHLHPSAQSKIGQFLSIVSNAGVTVIVETHSDHVVNGIQIAAAKQDINPELISINYFSEVEEEIQPNVESISINAKGELSKWPKGFFDQSQRDFAELFKFRKG